MCVDSLTFERDVQVMEIRYRQLQTHVSKISQALYRIAAVAEKNPDVCVLLGHVSGRRRKVLEGSPWCRHKQRSSRSPARFRVCFLAACSSR